MRRVSTDQSSYFNGQKRKFSLTKSTERKYSLTKSTEKFSNDNYGTYKVRYSFNFILLYYL